MNPDPAQNVIVTIAGTGLGILGDNGPATIASVDWPFDITVAGNGEIFIAQNTRIRKITTDGIIHTIAGTGTSGFSGDGGPATAAQINAAYGLVVDATGNVFFSDGNNHRVRKITPAGIITTIAGTGTSGFSGDGLPGTAAQLSYPGDIILDGAGNLIFSDYGNHKVRKLTPAGIISTVAGNGVSGFSGDGGLATAAQFNGPTGLAFDNSGNLLISDGNNQRVRRVTGAGVISTIVGAGVWGFGGDGAPAQFAQMRFPRGLAVDAAGNLYISDSNNWRVRRVDPGGIIQTFTDVFNPAGLAFDGQGNLLIAESEGHRIRKIRAAAPGMPVITSIVPSTGIRGTTVSAKLTGTNLTGATAVTMSGTGVMASISNVDSPTSLTLSITIASNAPISVRTVTVTTPNGQSDFFASFAVFPPLDDLVINTVAGTGVSGFNGDGIVATSAQLNGPMSIAFDGPGNLYIADEFNHRVRRVTPQGIISTAAGTGVANFGGDGGIATGASLNRPRDVAMDAAGNLYIADSLNHRVRKVTAGGIISTIAGNGIDGFGGDGGPATSASLSWPSGVALDGFGNVFIADTENNRIRMVNAAGVISTVAGMGSPGYTGDGGPANKARLSIPLRIAVGFLGDLFIADSGNSRVRKVNSMGIISTVAGNGAPGPDTTEGNPAVSVPIGAGAIAFNTAGELLIAEGTRVRRVDAAGTIRTIIGGGNSTGDNIPAMFAMLASAAGITVDPAGTVVLAESGSSRVRRVSSSGNAASLLTGISPASGMQGDTVSATLTGFNLAGANAVIVSGTGVSATISSGGTNTTVPIRISIAADAVPGARTVTLATSTGISNALASFAVNAKPAPDPPFVGSKIDGSPMLTVLTMMEGTQAAAMLSGSNFTGATSVAFSGTGVTATILPGGTATTIPLWIVVDAGAAVGGRTFTVTAASGTSPQRSGFNVIASVAGDIISTAAGETCCNFVWTGKIAADRAGNAFFSMYSAVGLLKIDTFGVVSYIGGPKGDVAADAQGNLYIADTENYRVWKRSPSGAITTFAGTGLSDPNLNIGDGGPAAAAHLLAPVAVEVDPSGNVVIGDGSRVRMVNSAGIITTIAGTGTSGFSGDGGPATSAQIDAANGLAFDSANNLLIADTRNNRIRMVNPAGIITTIAGTGQVGSTGDGGPASEAQLHPLDISSDRFGNLLITDNYSFGRVRVIDAAGTINVFAGTTSGFSGDFGPATAAQLYAPCCVTADGAGTVWISDTMNNRIRKVTRADQPVPSITSISPSSGLQGTTFDATITGSNLSGAAAAVFSGTGVTAVIRSGGTETSIPVSITIDHGAAAGSRTATVITRSNSTTPFNGFTVGATNVPNITSMSPSSGTQGTTFSATISGTNFAGATTLIFEGSGVTGTVNNATDTTISATITIALTASPGPRKATVKTPNGTSAPFNGLTVTAATPAVSSLNPMWATQGAVVQATITGTNLSNVVSVGFTGSGGVSAVISGPATPTSLPITITISPSAPAGMRSIVVATADRISTPGSAFEVLAMNGAYITGLSPGIGVQGSTMSAVITGYNLAGATDVTFTGTGVTAAIAAGNTSTRLPITITIAPGASLGMHSVSVTTFASTSPLFAGLDVQFANPIRITSISPVSVMQGTAFSATISGTNLAGATSVVFSGGGLTASVSNATATSLQIAGNVDANAATDLRTITVTTPTGTSDPFSGIRVTSTPRPSLISTLIGTGNPAYSGDGYNAAKLYLPSGTAVDNAGNIFIADYGNNRIRKITPNLVISTVAGTGAAGSGGDGGPATSATLNGPTSVTFDSNGNLFITDSNNHRIRKITPAGIISTVAGNGVPSDFGDGGPAVQANLNFPNSVALDAAGNLFIADTSNHRIRRVETNGIINTVAGDGTPGYGGDGSTALTAQLNLPAGVSVNAAGNIFIADFQNHRIRKVSGQTIDTIAGTGTPGIGGDGGPATSAQLAYPIDVKVDAGGNVFIVDYLSSRVRKITAGVINTIAGNGTLGFSGDGGPATSAQLAFPFGVTIAAGGTIYIADGDNHRVRKVSGGTISTVAGNGVWGFNGDGPAAIFAELRYPADAAVDAAGNVYIADQDNHRIRKVTPAGAVSTMAGDGTAGSTGDGGPATSAKLHSPAGVAVDGTGNVFIADILNSRVRKVTPDGVITNVAGTGTFGSSGDGGPATAAQLMAPIAVATDGIGNLYIVDTSANRVRMVSPTGVISTVAGSGFQGLGDGGPATAARLQNPTGVAVNASGDVFIADNENNRIRKVNSAGIITTVAGTGLMDFGGDDDPATTAQLNRPRDVAVDLAGNLFISDYGNLRIRMVNPAGIITTVAGNGNWPSSGDGGPAYSAQVTPVGMGVDGGGNLVVADTHRVRRIAFTTPNNLPTITAISPFSWNQGTVVPATISGSALNGATSITFSGTGVTASINGGGTETSLPITITIAAGATLGLRTFTVTTPGGTSEAFVGFTVTNSVPLPEITSITPSKGLLNSSVPAVINGTGLSGATAVTFSGTGVTASIGAGGTNVSLPITISIAANASLDLRLITVTTPGGTSIAFSGFNIVRPVITGISPSIGTPGFSIAATITGTNLAGATSVTFSGTGLSATVLPGATDNSVPVLISVSAAATPGGREVTVSAANSSSLPFTGFTVAAFGPSGMITTFAGDGTTEFKGDGGPAVLAGLEAAEHLAVDTAGNVYISDRLHNRIRKVALSGIITTVAGNGSTGFSGDNGPATLATFLDLAGIALDQSGNLFIMDRGNNRLRKVTPNGTITTIAGNGTPGFSGDNAQATLAQLHSADGIAVDAEGNVFIADQFNHRVRKVAANGIITTVAGNGTSAFSGDNGQATSASLSDPTGVAVDASGNLYIADYGNVRIRKVAPNGIITTYAGGGNSSLDGINALQAALHSTSDVFVDKDGNLFIADYSNRRLRKVSPAGIITTAAGSGFSGFYGDGGPAASAWLGPTDAAVDSQGNLFIADFLNNRIRKVTYAPPARRARGQVTSQ